jgi:predicted transcriptional regulator
MPKEKTVEEHLEAIENLLACQLLDKGYTINDVAKIVGCVNTRIMKIYPKSRKGKNNATKK